MPRNSAVTVPVSVVVSEAEPEPPAFTLAIPPEVYRGREYYAARAAMQSRDGILRNLRIALNSADGRTVTVNIIVK